MIGNKKYKMSDMTEGDSYRLKNPVLYRRAKVFFDIPGDPFVVAYPPRFCPYDAGMSFYSWKTLFEVAFDGKNKYKIELERFEEMPGCDKKGHFNESTLLVKLKSPFKTYPYIELNVGEKGLYKLVVRKGALEKVYNMNAPFFDKNNNNINSYGGYYA